MNQHRSLSTAARMRLCALLVFLGACGGGSAHPGAVAFPPDGPSDGASLDALSADGADSAATADVGAEVASDGGDGADAADGAAEADSASEVAADASLPPTTCGRGHAWAPWKDLEPDAIARFGGVSANGLSAVWTRLGGGIVTADRVNEHSIFGPPTPVPDAPIATLGRVAMDATGDRLAAPDALGRAILLWARSAPGSKWALVVGDASFDPLVGSLPASSVVSELAFSSSGETLWLLATQPGATPQLYESRWDSAASSWGAASAHLEAGLASVDASHRRRPTGMSSDDLTLFFFDEIAGIERTAWRAAPSAPFTQFEDLPGAPEAAPDAACSFLFELGQDPTAGSAGIFAAQ